MVHSDYKNYIILNFAYGNGPFLRTTELAIAVNNILEKKRKERYSIIVPLIYGEKQKQIMMEEFGSVIKSRPDEILLDKNLGQFLSEVFYDEKGYEESLKSSLKNFNDVEKKMEKYLSNGLKVKNFLGKEIFVSKNQIKMQINRCPRINIDLYPSYYTSFAYLSEILDRASSENLDFDQILFKKVAKIYKEIEDKQTICFIAEPGTFYYLKNEKSNRRRNEVLTPPSSLPPKENTEKIQKGVYITLTGIPGLEVLFKGMQSIGLKIYTNKPDVIPQSEKMLPNIISNKNILFHLARSGWGSIWLSFFAKTPFLAIPYSKGDDPEIYFNNLCLEKTKLGKIYKGESMNELLKFSEEYKKSAENISKELTKKYGTINGVEYTAEKIVDNFLGI